MPRSRRRLGLREIASRTGFSLVTVQRALATPELVADATRERIIKVIDGLGYIPDRNAGALLKRRTRVLAVVVSTVAHPTFAAAIDGITERAAEEGYEILLGQTGYRVEREAPVIKAMLGRRPEGLITTFNPGDAHTRKLIKLSGTPMVEMWDDPPDPIDMVVGISNERAGAAAAEYFAGRGRTRAAVFGTHFYRDEARWLGFAKAWRRLRGTEPERVLVGVGHQATEESYDSGGDFFEKTGQLKGRIDSVFCTSDITAAAVVFEAGRRGIDVPEELAVCGFGDLPFAGAMAPRLTTIAVPAYDMGRMAVEALLATHKSRGSTRRVVLDTPVLPRESG
ncbi:MAG: LacI family DNA-binding transcriptional regulator [Steroidobacteraceae bacterium]